MKMGFGLLGYEFLQLVPLLLFVLDLLATTTDWHQAFQSSDVVQIGNDSHRDPELHVDCIRIEWLGEEGVNARFHGRTLARVVFLPGQ